MDSTVSKKKGKTMEQAEAGFLLAYFQQKQLEWL